MGRVLSPSSRELQGSNSVLGFQQIFQRVWNLQSNYIAAFLIIGFIVYVTIRGEIPAYRQVLGI
jgi:hypothetical protein